MCSICIWIVIRILYHINVNSGTKFGVIQWEGQCSRTIYIRHNFIIERFINVYMRFKTVYIMQNKSTKTNIDLKTTSQAATLIICHAWTQFTLMDNNFQIRRFNVMQLYSQCLYLFLYTEHTKTYIILCLEINPFSEILMRINTVHSKYQSD